MEDNSNIYVVVARVELPTTAKKKISLGSKMVCKIQIKAKAAMFQAKYASQLEQLQVGNRVVILQNGYALYRKKYGAVRFVAAGTVKEKAQKLTKHDVIKNPELWIMTQKWNKDWPTEVGDISNEVILRFNLKKAKGNPNNPESSLIKPLIKPKGLIVNPKTVLMALKPGSKIYEETNVWWEKVTGQWNYSTPGRSEEKKKAIEATNKIKMLIKKS